MTKHSKHYNETDRNTDTTNSGEWHTMRGYISPNTQDDSIINPKMRMSKKELGLKDNRIPDYYKGRNGYEARKVCDNFELPYHLATATTYILRAYHKHDTPVDCITKAIAHLQFELEKIDDQQSS